MASRGLESERGREGRPAHNVLLLSCMDLRLLDEIVAYMDGRNLTDRYDHVILAGASLGVVHPAVPHWGETFWDHLGLAIELHQVAEVHVLEHRECGAYRKFLGLDFVGEPEYEERTHAEHVAILRTLIRARYPDLAVRGFLMALDGSVIPLALSAENGPVSESA